VKITHFVETTKERYIEHRDQYKSLTTYGGRVDIVSTERGDQLTQEKIYHITGPDVYKPFPQDNIVTLVGMAMFQRYHPEHSQYFILELVELGVTHKEVGKWEST
jgi:hypothetical protein